MRAYFYSCIHVHQLIRVRAYFYSCIHVHQLIQVHLSAARRRCEGRFEIQAKVIFATSAAEYAYIDIFTYTYMNVHRNLKRRPR